MREMVKVTEWSSSVQPLVEKEGKSVICVQMGALTMVLHRKPAGQEIFSTQAAKAPDAA